MANPQPDEFTKVANELMDQVPFFKFNGSQLRIILVIWRNTYGWTRKDHDFSLTFLHSQTGLSESAVKKEVTTLIAAKVLLVTKEATKKTSRRLAFNKDYDAWNIPKCGENMEPEQPTQLSFEGYDCDPLEGNVEVHDCDPPEGYDCDPQVATLRGTIVPPEKESLLKKVFKENVDPFTLFFETYPRRISKAAALKAWMKLQKEPGFDPIKIILHTKNFAETCKLLKTNTGYIPHPSTYLNQKRFLDYDRVDPEGLLNKPAAPARRPSKFEAEKERLQMMYEEAQREEDGSASAHGYHPDQLPAFRD